MFAVLYVRTVEEATPSKQEVLIAFQLALHQGDFNSKRSSVFAQ